MRFGIAAAIASVPLLWFAESFLRGECAACPVRFDHRWLLLPVVPIAALLAAAAAWLLARPSAAPQFGAAHGFIAALLAYVAFAIAFGAYVHFLTPAEPLLGTILLLLLGLVLAPFPTWFVPTAGALAGHAIGRWLERRRAAAS